ncbi:MAG TPA: PhzF family phenazine biosynthesis protein [Candidatus Polarisedimenticolia bacterium]|nr:PhzF family phenazine biosynthesis protein [Candidatus Polarisedimenticolia bacterium]
MRHRFLTADVFTDRMFGGNQLAVFPDGWGIAPEQMQRVAREFNFSETVFVLPAGSPEHSRRLRIFTPSEEIPFAGHPTIGTAFVLASIGDIPLDGEWTRIIFEEGAGPVPVRIRVRGGRPDFAQLVAPRPPEVGPPPPPRADLAAMLGLDPGDLLDEPQGPQGVSCGLPYLLVPLKNRDAVRRARVRIEVWEKVLATYWSPHVFVFASEAEHPGHDLRARMFGPAVGVVEDPATGSAATALGGYLGVRDRRRDGTLRFVVEQGFEMGRPSLLEIEVDKKEGGIREIRVGGASVLVSEGTMEIPEP